MNILLTFAASAAFSCGNLSLRYYQMKLERKSADSILFQALTLVVGALLLTVCLGVRFDLDRRGLLLAAVYGVCAAVQTVAVVLCFLTGPVSLTAVIVDASLFLSVLYGCLFLGERITRFQLLGGAFLLGMFILSAPVAGARRTGMSLPWFLTSLVAFFGNGAVMILMKVYKLGAPQSDGNAFLVVGFLISACVMTCCYFMKSGLQQGMRAKKEYALYAALTLVVGAATCIGYCLLMYLSVRLPAAMLYPLMNGANCVTVSALSCLLLRERMTRRKLAAVLAGIAAIVLLNL